MGIYSGAGGYAAYRPGLVGLTPGQFREVRSVSTGQVILPSPQDHFRKFGEDRGLEEEQELTTSDV